jgi:two-component system, LytTR family, sensor kinase
MKSMVKMKWNYVPYIAILVFTIIVTLIRYYMIPEWSFEIHVLLFFFQFVLLCGIWLMIKGLSNYFDKKIPFSQNVSTRLFIQISASLLLFAPVFILLVVAAKPYLPDFANKQFITLAFVLLMVMIILLNLGLSAYYFFRQWQQSVEEKAALQVQAAEIRKDKSMMRYHNLRNQVNPHFLFNTFTSLDGLIQTDPDLASEFVRHLSKVYRYVLEHKENEVVSLQTELEFIQHYISLLHIRYRSVLEINVDISSAAKEKGIVMVTLQMLIDNAIKHNALQLESPLKITIRDEGEYLHILNTKQLRKQIETSNKHGLQQLKELYSYFTNKKVVIHDSEKSFEINLPLL